MVTDSFGWILILKNKLTKKACFLQNVAWYLNDL